MNAVPFSQRKTTAEDLRRAIYVRISNALYEGGYEALCDALEMIEDGVTDCGALAITLDADDNFKQARWLEHVEPAGYA